MFRFYLQWSKGIQFAANSIEENRKPKYLQNPKTPYDIIWNLYTNLESFL